MLLFAACGKDDDEDSKNSKEISYVKTITYTGSDGHMEKIVFTYENNKLKNVTDFYGEESYSFEFKYTSDNSIKMVGDEECETIITLDPSTKTISKIENVYDDVVYTTNYTFKNSFLASTNFLAYKTWECEDSDLYTWSNNNLTEIKKMYEGEVEKSITIAYSDIDNNTNIDIILWMMNSDFVIMSHFIKNISTKIPSSIKINDWDELPISTSLDEKGRPTKMTFNGETYTFEYYD